MKVYAETDTDEMNDKFASLSGVLAFDVGANCGQSVKRLLPAFGRVVAVEPADESFEVLRGIYADDPRVTLIQAACTDHPGPVSLDVRDVIDSGQLTTGPPGHLPWGAAHHRRTVPGITVDELTAMHGAADLLKVDTEGHETFVLQGAHSTLTGDHPYVLIEIHSERNGHDCNSLLIDAGYEHLERIAHTGYRPGSWGLANHYWLVGT